MKNENFFQFRSFLSSIEIQLFKKYNEIWFQKNLNKNTRYVISVQKVVFFFLIFNYHIAKCF